jgi:predicted ATPase
VIKELALENIRLFEGSGWHFPLSRLTVFCGTNSSGKSTILKLPLLLRQSMGINESYESGSGKLRFYGSQVDLGSYDSLVSNNDYRRNIVVEVKTENTMPVSVANRLRAVGSHRGKPAGKSPSNVQYICTATYRFRAASIKNEIEVKDFIINEDEVLPYIELEGILESSEYVLTVGQENLLNWEVIFSDKDKEGDREYSILIPNDYFRSIKGFPKIEIDYDFRKGYAKIGVILDGILPRGLIGKLLPEEGELFDDESERKLVVSPLPPDIFQVVRNLKNDLVKIDYIGPLRSPAKRYYLTQPDISPRMDPAGEFLPFILRNIGEYNASYIRPGENPKPIVEPLFIALNVWMHYIRTGQKDQEHSNNEISWNTNRALVEINVRSILGNELHALADSGFGYSQLLPIIVRGLLAEEDHVIIVEQPELHLNPAIQLRLAEFLVSLARMGKQVLIETHSEHIVNTIRVLSAEDESGELANMCKIYYIDVSSGKPQTIELSVQQNGMVPDWPTQFFGEASSLTGRLLRAQKGRRKIK